MKVLFTENIKNVARIGDIKNVADGYARNFLIPNKLAKPATGSALKEAETLKKRRLEHEAENKKQAEEMVGLLEGKVVEIEEDANEGGHLYGSVNVDIISEKLQEQKIKIKADHINLFEPIKEVGEYDIEVELHPEVKTKIKVIVKAVAEKK
ncbi:MAG: 50S ribosomal protein L9 [Candidatus Yanofskybacteria bacterium CG10_big_fil_rev_8_21_14_0_10_36_16]|uniref:Large ribosomal subunit protein bL9 n=1 Tax=Candidatus Yanofskybacteria bacterium CG10_big_fil_rev_8_21_14_0_10_36_16 TaxID=1975096 RepID=A0A2J0Q782_9BACT|nr:MAG: 50S ribosomal protein L9 [Candidatus Yanofskybacteria bacterium CG10_big_fil_rev_8_21_14_0_10_36_16]